MIKKFRVWDDKTQKFSYFDIRNSFGHIPNDIEDGQIQQFVGLLDKNNKEIYEGDYVHLQSGRDMLSETFLIEFSCKGVLFSNKKYRIYQKDRIYGALTVEGNIFENKL